MRCPSLLYLDFSYCTQLCCNPLGVLVQVGVCWVVCPKTRSFCKQVIFSTYKVIQVINYLSTLNPIKLRTLGYYHEYLDFMWRHKQDQVRVSSLNSLQYMDQVGYLFLETLLNTAHSMIVTNVVRCHKLSDPDLFMQRRVSGSILHNKIV